MPENRSYYDIVKTCKGALVLNLPAFDSSAIDKRVEFAWNETQRRIPRMYAPGIFNDSTLENMYKAGYFKVEPVAEFEREIAAIFAPVEEKVSLPADDEIIRYLKAGNRIKVSELNVRGGVVKDTIISLARTNIGDIPTSMVKDLEDLLGVELAVENE